MHKSVLGLVASGLVVACGCTQGTPGGPGVKTQPSTQNQTTYKPTVSDSKQTFSLKVPVVSTSLKQGETKSASITIERGSNFDEDVRLTFSDIPAGVTLDPATATMKQGDKEQKISISATDNAALGDFSVKVTGHPSKGGPDASNEFKLNIAAK